MRAAHTAPKKQGTTGEATDTLLRLTTSSTSPTMFLYNISVFQLLLYVCISPPIWRQPILPAARLRLLKSALMRLLYRTRQHSSKYANITTTSLGGHTDSEPKPSSNQSTAFWQSRTTLRRPLLHLGPRVVLMMSDTAFAAVMFPSCAARPVSLLVLTGRTITGALMVAPGSAAATRG